jgi:hypothetical protein
VAAGCRCCCGRCCWGVLLTGPNMSSRSNPAAAECTTGDGGPAQRQIWQQQTQQQLAKAPALHAYHVPG